jgi:adenylate kinase family enzyme
MCALTRLKVEGAWTTSAVKPLIQRDDDKEETVEKRLEVYSAKPDPWSTITRRGQNVTPLRPHATEPSVDKAA